jgi:hypothetical protein
MSHRPGPRPVGGERPATRFILVSGLLAAVLLVGCGNRPVQGAGLFVRIERGEGISTCVRVTVTGDDGEQVAAPRDFSPQGVVALGIIQDAQGPEVTVTAVGGRGAACTPTQPPERAQARFRFPSSGTSNEVLVLQPAASSDGGAGDAGGTDAGPTPDGGADGGTGGDGGPVDGGGGDGGSTDAGAVDSGTLPDAGSLDGGVDQDGDGSPAGVDCDDQNPNRFPGNPERCFGGVDDDCDSLVDCADSSCASAACGLGVDGGAACVTGVCVELDCASAADDDLDNAPNCLDSDCAMRPCALTGTCMGLVCVQPTETVCNDGMDNDGDTFADCADGDCNGQSCRDALSCTAGETCSGGACTGGTAVTCQPPPSVCFAAATCAEPDAGCFYAPLPTTPCTDGLRCTENDACLTDGGCRGRAVVCQQTTDKCREEQGACVEADGGCAFPPVANGTSCDDGNPCTLADACQAGACQSGSPASCAVGVCRFLAATCLSDGGCDVRNLDAGTPCDGGVCNGAGGCGRFPFPPSNFDEAAVPADAGPALVITCPATVTVLVDGGVTVMSGCGVPVPAARLVDQSAPPRAMLITTPGLFIADAGSLTINGVYPVIIAVTGNADVAGAIDVSAAAAAPGPGADGTPCMGSLGGRGQTDGGLPRGGGAGGSFGTVGSNGGRGDGASLLGGLAGVPSGNTELVPLRGGCSGGQGGGVQGPGAAGRAGGAIQLSVAGTLRVRGRVTAAGRGGGGANADLEAAEGPGGGGGGSGGGILLEANQVDITGHVAANGGGGGAGEAGSGVAPNGANGNPFSTANAAGATAPGGGGGSGGRGAARAGGSLAGQNGGPSNGGGGGGGGGAGRIRINANTCSGTPLTMSPQATGACPY